jgi:hypothetical protein
MNQPDLFSQPALVAREKGIAKVAANSPTWIEKAHALIKEYPKEKATGEDLKVFLRERIGEASPFQRLRRDGDGSREKRTLGRYRRVPHYETQEQSRTA